MSRFEWGGELAGQEMYGGVGEPGELCVVLCHAQYNIWPQIVYSVTFLCMGHQC